MSSRSTITFTGHYDVNTQGESLPDWDKFLACCYDADYCTVSDCSFGLHEYGIILGYPSDDENSYNNYNNFPRMSLISNLFTNTVTRGPGLMRYGYFHSLNNYVNTFSMAYTVHTASKIYAENCYYDGGSIKGNVICDWNTVNYPGAYAESGSVFVNCKRTSIEGYAQNCTWRPDTNYNYISMNAENAKTYCSDYSGCQNSRENIMYMRFSSKGIPSAGYTEVPSQPLAESFSEGTCYRFKNANSGLYMQVEDANAVNGANVQQWGSDNTSVHDIWKLFSAGNGYYYIVSCIGEGSEYVLDVAGKKTANGTNIDIYKYNGNANQQFMFVKNTDGSYKILTGISEGKSAVEVRNAGTSAGENIQQYEVNGASCQNWIPEPVSDPGISMDTDLIYTFENLNSGLVMDIENGLMENNSNVQQYISNKMNCQKWTLKSFGSGNYYWIRSLQNENYALKAEGNGNGSNIDIAEYSSKDSSQLFRFTKNLNGSYSIITHASKDNCLVETSYASEEKGANIQQWERTDNDCQKWELHTEKRIVTISGDVNNDGIFNITDALILQRWLLGMPDTTLEILENGDLYDDGILNVFDLCIMKKMLIQ